MHFVQVSQMLIIHVDGNRLVLIDKHLLKASLSPIFRVQFQVFDHFKGKDTRLQDLNLVVDTSRIGDNTQILHVGKHLTIATAIVHLILDKHLCGHLINRRCIAQINQRAADENKHRQQEPLPIKNYQCKDCPDVKREFFFLYVYIL